MKQARAASPEEMTGMLEALDFAFQCHVLATTLTLKGHAGHVATLISDHLEEMPAPLRTSFTARHLQRLREMCLAYDEGCG